MDKIIFNNYIKLPLELGGALPKIAIWYNDSVYMIKEGKYKNNIYQKSYIAENLSYEDFVDQFVKSTPISQIKGGLKNLIVSGDLDKWVSNMLGK